MMAHSLGFDVVNPLGHEPQTENLHSQIVYAAEIFYTKLTYSQVLKFSLVEKLEHVTCHFSITFLHSYSLQSSVYVNSQQFKKFGVFATVTVKH